MNKKSRGLFSNWTMEKLLVSFNYWIYCICHCLYFHACELHVCLFNDIVDPGIVPEDWVVGLIKYVKSWIGLYHTSYTIPNVLKCMFCERVILSLRKPRQDVKKATSPLITSFYWNILICIVLPFVFIDYSKPFDTVWRDAFWHKLLEADINDKFLDVVMNMYKNIKLCVFVNGIKSKISWY